MTQEDRSGGGWVRPGGAASAAPHVPGVVMLRLLGAGGQGQVWLARDLVRGELVAVKVGPAPPTGSVPDGLRGEGLPGRGSSGAALPELTGEAATQLAREVALLRRIDDPHVIRLRRVVNLPKGSRALVMDHAAGGSLTALLARRGRLDAAEVCTIAVPLGRTLAQLHERGLVHGDLTPSNVLFTADGRPLIADLGCAVVLGEPAAAAWGSEGYCDPRRTGPAGPSDDVYALGALLRFALTGDPEASPDATDGDDDPGRTGLLDLAARCTAADPAQRPDPRAVADAASALATPAPIRLQLPTGAEPSHPGELVGRDRLDAGAGGGSGRGVRGSPAGAGTRPIVVRFEGWPPKARPPIAGDALSGDAAEGDPLLVGPAARDARLAEAMPWEAPRDGSAPAARVRAVPVTRRRPQLPSEALCPPSEVPRPVQGGASPPRRRASHARSAARPSRAPHAVGRSALWAVALAVATGGLGWWSAGLFTGGDERAAAMSGPPAVAASGVPTQGGVPRGAVERLPSALVRGRAGTAGAVPSESAQAAVERLARGRAEAFHRLSEASLVLVDEPGSVAHTSDLALIRRLASLGVRLDGLRFEVGAVHVAMGPGDSVLVSTTVRTSAHRQVGLRDGRVRAVVAAGAPQRLTLTLVRAPDGRHWLVRAVRAEEVS